MSTFHKIIQKTTRFVSSKMGLQVFLFATAFIFVVSISFIVGSIFSTNQHKENSQQSLENTQQNAQKSLDNTELSSSGSDALKKKSQDSLIPQKNLTEPHALTQLFSEQNLNSNLVPNANQKKSPEMTSLENAFLKNDLQIFEFNAGNQEADPMNKLSELIQEIYSIDTPLLDIAQEINASIFQTFAHFSIKNEDILFAENAARLSQQGEPYPFIVLELSRKDSNLPYFQSKKEKEEFISVLLNNIKRRELPQKSSKKKQFTSTKLSAKVKLINEESFLYITYNNIISHVIRLEPRTERIRPLSPLKSEKFYFTLIIDDVGENLTIARKLMDLPFPVVFSIWPQSTHGTSIATLAHEKGLPVFLHQPMEPMPNANRVPRMGVGGLKVGMSQEEITRILQKNILSVPHLRGINNHMGSKFTTHSISVNTFLLALRNIMPHALIVDSLTHSKSFLYSHAKQHGFLTGKRNYFIDDDENILQALNRAYIFAKKNKHAYVIGHARRETLKALLKWDKYKDKNIVFTLPSH